MTLTKPIVYCMFATMILLLSLALPAAAQKQVPFKGAIQAHDTDKAFPSPTSVVVDTDGTGIGTLLGQFSFHQETTVDFLTGTDSGSGHWTAANGDSLDTTVVGSGEPTDIPDVVKITELNTITGGTGRFAGAQGTFVVERLANVATFVTSGAYHGTIASPGASH
jgi:hypothetical protein